MPGHLSELIVSQHLNFCFRAYETKRLVDVRGLLPAPDQHHASFASADPLQQLSGQDANHTVLPALCSNVHDKALPPLFYTADKSVFAAARVLKALQRGAVAPEDDGTLPYRGQHYGHITRIVAGGRVAVLIEGILLVVYDNQGQSAQRQEHSGPRGAYHYAFAPVEVPEQPGVAAQGVFAAADQHLRAFKKALQSVFHPGARVGLGAQNQHLPSLSEGLPDCGGILRAPVFPQHQRGAVTL